MENGSKTVSIRQPTILKMQNKAILRGLGKKVEGNVSQAPRKPCYVHYNASGDHLKGGGLGKNFFCAYCMQ